MSSACRDTRRLSLEVPMCLLLNQIFDLRSKFNLAHSYGAGVIWMPYFLLPSLRSQGERRGFCLLLAWSFVSLRSLRVISRIGFFRKKRRINLFKDGKPFASRLCTDGGLKREIFGFGEQS
ncbi:hypothetical protein CEXT_657951 [Caerostris extrusa]|uniref:Uncharacterized protein n=1 Tax=Caerostris extrusa TaxID=172846 RepID=A0AAV4VUA5_CAEEX|nr:hypothetical protein CEXT_657951 [Caerostris extrusa]